MTAITFTVHGIAQPAGSKKGFYNKKAGRVIITDDAKKSRPWKAQVSDAAARAMTFTGADGTSGYLLPLEGPLHLELAFYVPRPKGHTGKRGLLPSAPPYPAVRPDITKLVRAVEDALTGIVWRDDAQIVSQHVTKDYGGPARCDIHVNARAPHAQELVA